MDAFDLVAEELLFVFVVEVGVNKDLFLTFLALERVGVSALLGELEMFVGTVVKEITLVVVHLNLK